jgi:hypothetical protein
MAPILAPILGTNSLGEHISLKMGRFPSFQPRFKLFQGHVLSYQMSSTPGRFVWDRTFTAARTDLLHSCPFQLSFSLESTLARVKASKRGAKCYPRGDY